MKTLLTITLIAFIFCVGVAIGYVIARRKNQKGPLEVGSVVAPPGSTVLIRIEDGLNEQELEMLRLWMVAAIKACPGITFAVVCDALFRVQVIRPTL